MDGVFDFVIGVHQFDFITMCALFNVCVYTYLFVRLCLISI